jgi:hypothetical protein
MLRQLQRAAADGHAIETRETLDEFLKELLAEMERARLDPDVLVYGHMPAAAADRLIMERTARPGVLADRILLAHAAADSIQEIETALHRSGFAPSHRERLAAGLAALDDPGETWAVPCDLLLGGIEGVVWDLSTSRKLTSIDREGMPRDANERPVLSVNVLLRADHSLGLSTYLRQFLADRFFTREGHGVRHRRRPELQRDWTAYALVALRGLLDEHGGHRLIENLAERLTFLTRSR